MSRGLAVAAGFALDYFQPPVAFYATNVPFESFLSRSLVLFLVVSDLVADLQPGVLAYWLGSHESMLVFCTYSLPFNPNVSAVIRRSSGFYVILIRASTSSTRNWI